jgi:hypothetical protein
LIVSFEGYVPIPRFDNTPWTQVTIDEAIAADGPWVPIDTIALDPVDTDPTQPQARDFTTENATLIEGWYKVTFVDALGNRLETEPIQDIPEDTPEYIPTLQEVGALLRARTVDTTGTELGTFTADTRPTGSEAMKLIGDAATDVADEVGGDIPDAAIQTARQAAAYRAAMLIELSYYPEQVGTNRSPYAEYKALYDEKIAKIIRIVQDLEEEEDTDDTTLTGGMASFNFPKDAGGLIGWGTEW